MAKHTHADVDADTCVMAKTLPNTTFVLVLWGLSLFASTVAAPWAKVQPQPVLEMEESQRGVSRECGISMHGDKALAKQVPAGFRVLWRVWAGCDGSPAPSLQE